MNTKKMMLAISLILYGYNDYNYAAGIQKFATTGICINCNFTNPHENYDGYPTYYTNEEFNSALTKARALGVTIDLSYSNLSNLNLNKANLTGINFTGAKLSDAYLASADLSNSILTNAKLTNTDFVYANLTNADLSHANLGGANLTATNLTNTNLSNAILIGVNFGNSTTTNTNFNKALINDKTFYLSATQKSVCTDTAKIKNVNIKITFPPTGGPYSVYHDVCESGNGLTCLQWKNSPARINPTQGDNYTLPSTIYDKYFVALSNGKEIVGTSHKGIDFINYSSWSFSPDGKTNTIL